MNRVGQLLIDDEATRGMTDRFAPSGINAHEVCENAPGHELRIINYHPPADLQTICGVVPINEWCRKGVIAVDQDKIEGGQTCPRQIHLRRFENRFERVDGNPPFRTCRPNRRNFVRVRRDGNMMSNPPGQENHRTEPTARLQRDLSRTNCLVEETPEVTMNAECAATPTVQEGPVGGE